MFSMDVLAVCAMILDKCYMHIAPKDILYRAQYYGPFNN